MPPVGYCGEVVTLSTSSFPPPPLLVLFLLCVLCCVLACVFVCAFFRTTHVSTRAYTLLVSLFFLWIRAKGGLTHPFDC